MNLSPASVLASLDSVRAVQLPRAEQQARFALLYTQARDKCGYDDICDSLIVRAVGYYAKHGAVRERALAHYYHGRILSNVGDSEGAVEAYLAAAASADRLGDPYLQGLIDNAVGQQYSSQRFFGKAAACYEAAIADFRLADAPYNEGLVLENLGYVEYMMGNLEDAKRWYGEALQIFIRQNLERDVLRIGESIAAVRMADGETMPAVKNSLRKLYRDYGQQEIPVTSLGLWIDIYKQEGQLDSARVCGLKVLENREQFDSTALVGCYALLAEIEYLKGDFRQAYLDCKYSGLLADSVFRQTLERSVFEVTQRYDNRELKQHIEYLKRLRNYQLVAILSVCGSLFAIFAYWLKRKVGDLRRIREELLSMRDQFEEQQGHYREVLQQLDGNREEEARLCEALLGIYESYRDLLEKARTSASFRKDFLQLIKIRSSTRCAFADLQYVVNRRYHGILKHLEKTHPGLSRFDLDLLGLVCLGFSSDMVTCIYGYVDKQVFYNRTSHIRNKLGMDRNCKLEQFLSDEIRKLSGESR